MNSFPSAPAWRRLRQPHLPVVFDPICSIGLLHISESISSAAWLDWQILIFLGNKEWLAPHKWFSSCDKKQKQVYHIFSFGYLSSWLLTSPIIASTWAMAPKPLSPQTRVFSTVGSTLYPQLSNWVTWTPLIIELTLGQSIRVSNLSTGDRVFPHASVHRRRYQYWLCEVPGSNWWFLTCALHPLKVSHLSTDTLP